MTSFITPSGEVLPADVKDNRQFISKKADGSTKSNHIKKTKHDMPNDEAIKQELPNITGETIPLLTQTDALKALYDDHVVKDEILIGAETIQESYNRILERDAGFVSGGDDDDSCSGPAHSDDSGVRLTESDRKRDSPPIRLQPPKKRIRLSSRDELTSPECDNSVSPFRPWNFTEEPQSEPLSLVKKSKEPSLLRQRRRPMEPPPPPMIPPPPIVPETRPGPPRVPPHPGVTDNFLEKPKSREQRNYKNMTRERRIEANARERTRVHTISAAFDKLRGAIPAYSHNQKLSKLSVLRIACAYIGALSAAANPEEDLGSAVESVTQTIHTEGKLRKKKDDP